jgi:RNA polymerase sporulation-specific sigma factor
MEGMSMNRSELIQNNINLVYHVAHKYFPHTLMDNDDLYSVGFIGLINAANSFDETQGKKFSTFACKCIFHEICKAVNFNKRFVGVVSLDSPIPNHSGRIAEDTLYWKDIVIDREDRYEKAELKYLINDLLTILSPQEKSIVVQVYCNQVRMEDVAKIYHVSRQRISQICQKALLKLRNSMGVKIYA